jgi:hypothetical protein
MGCALLSPSLSSHISDPQKSEQLWELITHAVVVSKYGNLWHKKIHVLMPVLWAEVTETTCCLIDKLLLVLQTFLVSTVSLAARDLEKKNYPLQK